MGRSLLMAGAAALLAACAPERPAPTESAAMDTAGARPLAEAHAGSDSHADMPCAACHNGPITRNRIASVTRESCTTSGCHEEGGPLTVATGTATFQHQNHGRDGGIAVGCAGCHAHAEGRAPLVVSADGCALCHLTDLRGSKPAECRLCHQQLQHVALTSQALPIPHSSLPWVETGCVRCHYDVAEPRTAVPTNRCTDCHGRDTTMIARGIGTDLHPTHTSLSCTSCHEQGAHRVRAMSSAVQLNCADCHVTAHALDLQEQWATTQTCDDCHQTVHQAQQRLLLGVMPDGSASPSAKFIAGMTCRSCHIRTDGAVASGNPIRGQAEACASCHRGEYRQVLDWWLEGTRQRTADVGRYLDQARTRLAGAQRDSVRALLDGADQLLSMVRDAGGHHNLELSDRIFREVVARTQRAYTLAGRAPAQPPALGSPAHEGVCSYCHYAPSEPWDFRRMSEPFHRAVMGGTQ